MFRQALHRCRFFVLALIYVVFFDGCGSSSSNVSISGSATLNDINKAKIKLVNLKSGAELGYCITGSDGICTMGVPATSDPTTLVVTGYDSDGDGVSNTTYTRESDQSTVTLGLTTEIKALVPSLSSGAQVVISAYSHQIASLAINTMGDLNSNAYTADDYSKFEEKARYQIAEMYGQEPEYLNAWPHGDSSTAQAARFAQGAWDQYVKNMGSTLDPLTAVAYMGENVKDGALESTDSAVSSYSGAYGVLASGFTGSNGFSAAVTAWKNNSNCPSAESQWHTNHTADFRTPDADPPNWVGSYKNYFDQKAGGRFDSSNDPCADLTATACPKNPNPDSFDPKYLDAYYSSHSIPYLPPGVTAATYSGYRGSNEGNYYIPPGASVTTAPTSGGFEALMISCSVSGTTATATITKSDGGSPSTMAYTYKVLKMTMTGPVTVVDTTSGSNVSIVVASLTHGAFYDVKVNFTSALHKDIELHANCYTP